MFNILKQIICDHKNALLFVRNVGGDEQTIHHVSGGGLAKSEWECQTCKAKVYKDYRVGD